MNELVIAGVAVGGLVLLDQLDSSSSAPPGSVTQTQSAGDAAKAACNYLRGKQPLAGVTWQVPSTNSPASAYRQMREAMVGAYGSISSSQPFPREIHPLQLFDIIDAWIGAYAAGCHVSAGTMENYSLGGDWPGTCESAACDLLASGGGSLDVTKIGVDRRTPLGVAVCNAAAVRDSLQSWDSVLSDESLATSDQIAAVFAAVNNLATEMDGADYTFPGLRETDKAWSLSDVEGGLRAAGIASAEAVGSIAGRAIGGIAGAVVGSSLFWFVGLAFVGYTILRRAG